MKSNTVSRRVIPIPTTHQGGRAEKQTALEELERTVTNCLLFEKTFYESGSGIADRIKGLVAKCDPHYVANLADHARNHLGLRHVALYLVACLASSHPSAKLGTAFEDERIIMAPNSGLVSAAIYFTISRADELAEFLALYWKINAKRSPQKNAPLSNQVKKGLAYAFTKFDEYALGKYNRDADIKLRDVLFLTHPRPLDTKMQKLWDKLVEGKLAIPDTWEVQLSSGADKKSTWERLMDEQKLGVMALIRNLRNMTDVGVDKGKIVKALSDAQIWGVLPYQFMTAMKHAPQYEADLEQLMYKALEQLPKLKGTTIFVVDHSGSMNAAMSGKSEATRFDAACGLAIQLREQCDRAEFFTFSEQLAHCPARRGMALAEALKKNQHWGGTYLGASLRQLSYSGADRIVVLTDEQSADSIPAPQCDHGYIINVGPYAPAIDTRDKWTRINGFSERVVEWIQAVENPFETSADA